MRIDVLAFATKISVHYAVTASSKFDCFCVRLSSGYFIDEGLL